MMFVRKLSLYLSILAAAALVAGLLWGSHDFAAGTGMALAVFLALGLGSIPSLKGYQYTAWSSSR